MLKVYSNIKPQSTTDYIGFFLVLVLVPIIFFNAYYLEVTYDEAYTYITSGQPHTFKYALEFKIANHHILNSFLIALTSIPFPFSIMAMRLPAVIFGLFYLVNSIIIAKEYKNQLITQSLLILFYFSTLYFSLARGYAISSSCILAMIVLFKKRNSIPNWFTHFCIFSVLSIYANFIAIPLVLTFHFYILSITLKFKTLPISKLYYVAFIGLTLFSIYILFQVTQENRPLYGSYDQGILEAIVKDTIYRFLGGYISSNYTVSTTLITINYILTPVLIGVTLYTGFKVHKPIENLPITVLTIVTILGISLTSILLHKPLPTGRVLLPFWPMFAISCSELLEIMTKQSRVSRKQLQWFNTLACFGLFINFLFHFQNTENAITYDLEDEQVISSLGKYGSTFSPLNLYYQNHLSYIGQNEIRPENLYYILRERHKNIILKQINQQHPTDTIDHIIVKQFQNPNFVSLEFLPNSPQNELSIRLISDSDTIYDKQQIINQSSAFNLPLIFPLPIKSIGQQFIIVNNDSILIYPLVK